MAQSGTRERRTLKVVFFHAGLGDARLWARQTVVLSEHYEVAAPDMPGWGEAPLPTAPFSYVDFAAAFLPGVLIGNSFGGTVALYTALTYAERVAKLVLIAAALPTWDWSDDMKTFWAEEERALETGDLDRATEVNLDFWVRPEHRDEVRPQQRRAFELQTTDGEPELIWPDVPPFSSLRLPTLVVVGSDDKPDFQAIARHLADEIPDAELAVVRDAGHLVGIDQPQELNALLLGFLG